MTADADAILIRRARRGDEAAFRALVERHHATVYASVRAVLGDRDDVADVVQEVYVRVFRGLAGFRGESRFSTWVYRIARRSALDAVRRAPPAGEPLDGVDAADPGGPADRAAERASEAAWLERGLARLDERTRTVLELHYMAGRPYGEIAELLGVPEGTVKTLAHRGRIRLRAILARGGRAAAGGGGGA